ncbi:hypothetical protein GGE67_000551 [Rhizobium leucaenae]|nr:hypothetical protein [Rhizobium leucaenae]
MVRELVEDDYAPTGCAAGSDEPMRRADYKAKKHPRPRNVDCRGRFALRHQKPGRVLASLEGGE